MIVDGISIKNNKLYLSYQWLIENSEVAENSLKCWKVRDIGERLYIDNRAYVNYDTIPAPSRSKLPKKEDIIEAYEAHKKSQTCPFIKRNEEYCIAELEKAYRFGFPKYRQFYLDNGFESGKATKKARHHAVLARMAELHKIKEGKLSNLHIAYNKIYPGGYSYKSFNYVINRLHREGITAITLPKYDNTPKNHQFGNEYEAFVLRYLSSGKAYSRVYVYDCLSEECERLGWKKPSYTWVKDAFQRLMPLAYKERYGANEYNSKKAPYAGIIKALHTHDQWQIDGWRLPFYMEGEPGEKNYQTLNLFAVMDASSGHIIGYDIARSENTENILRGLESAIKEAGCLPYEIVSDNHSFNKTKEAEYFKAHLEKLGMTWTVDSNPRRKGVIERRLGVFGDKFLKKYPGYIGQGIRTKNPDGLTSPEEIEKYTKAGSWRTEEEIRIYAHLTVKEYNKYVSKKTGVSPMQLYIRPEQPNKIPVTNVDIIRLFTRESEYTVRRGQINIIRERHTYEYQLNSELYLKYNDKKVRVRYADFEEIYLFDLETDAFITTVKHKSKIHGALANQTEKDKQLLYKNAGRLKGIEAKRRKAQQEIIQNDNLDASERINPMVHTKVDMEELAQDSKLSGELLEKGVDITCVPQPKVFEEDNTFKPKEKETRLTESKKHKIKQFKFNPSDEGQCDDDLTTGKDQPFLAKGHKIKVFEFPDNK